MKTRKRTALVAVATLVLSMLVEILSSAPPAMAQINDLTQLGGGTNSSNANQFDLNTSNLTFTSGNLYLAFLGLTDADGNVTGCDGTDPTPGVITKTGDATNWEQVTEEMNGTFEVYGVSAYRFVPETSATAQLQTDLLTTDPDCPNSLHEGFIWNIIQITGAWYTGGANGSGALAQVAEISLPGSETFSAGIQFGDIPASDSLVIAGFGHTEAEVSEPDDQGNTGQCPPGVPDTVWGEVSGTDINHINPTRAMHVIYDNTTPGDFPGTCFASDGKIRGVAIEVRDAPAGMSPRRLVPVNGANPYVTTGGSSQYVLDGTYTFTANRLYLAYVALSASSPDDSPGLCNSNCTVPDGTWTLVRNTTGQGMTMSIYRFRPTSGQAGTKTVRTEPLSSSHTGAYVSIVEIVSGFDTSGSNGSGAIGLNAAANASTATELSVPLGSPPGPNNVVVAGIGHIGTAPQVPKTGSGYAELPSTQGSHAMPNRVNEWYVDDSTPGSSPGAQWGTETSNTRGVAVEIKAAPTTAWQVVGAGDICQSAAGCAATGDIAADVQNSAAANIIITLGDNAYDSGTLSEYNTKFEPSWGPGTGNPLSDIYPTAGNHEWETPNAQGYRDYFGPTRSTFEGTDVLYWSFSAGPTGSRWFFVDLDTDPNPVSGGTRMTSAQEGWLDLTLTNNTNPCEIVYGHHPRWADDHDPSGHGDNTHMSAVWSHLIDNKVDLFITGHEHNYQLFPRMDVNGAIAPAGTGTREIVVGTGGASLDNGAEVGDSPAAEPVFVGQHSVLLLTLQRNPNQYSWQLIDEGATGPPYSGAEVLDSGGPISCWA